MSGIDLAIDSLKSQVSDLKQEFSEARKKGVDVSLPYLRFLNLPSKIGIVVATKSLQDIKQVSSLISEVKEDLENAKREGTEGVEKNDEKNYTERIQKLMDEAAIALQQKNREGLLKLYSDIRGVYPFIPEALKKETYKRSLELYSALQKS